MIRTFIAGKTPRSWISYVRDVGKVEKDPDAAEIANKTIKKCHFYFIINYSDI